MKPEVITAIIAAIVPVIIAVISTYGQNRIARLTDRLTKQREAESRESQTAALMSKEVSGKEFTQVSRSISSS